MTVSRNRRYTFSRLLGTDPAQQPRGGTSTGPAVTLATGVNPAWSRLQSPELSAYERDRSAILAMAGAYRARFEFLETFSLTPTYTDLDRPYQSWATEFVYVIEDDGPSIGLQHVMVMFFETEEGVSGPHVIKHWRQDWTYEDAELHVFRGHGRWERRRLAPEERRGRWSQAVFQVDDSPRYEAMGRWLHHGNRSEWESETTWRPLPRREFSVRSDYHVLVGENRHTITPSGWIHEQDNAKRVLGSSEADYLSREIGLNRYDRIVGHDFSAGDAYWERTAPYWAEVRRQWREVYAAHDTFELKSRADGRLRFEVHFQNAEELVGAPPEEIRSRVASVFARYVVAVP